MRYIIIAIRKKEAPMDAQMPCENGSKNANGVGGTTSGASYRMEIP